MPEEKTVNTLNQLCADMRCTYRERLLLVIRLHQFRAEKAQKALWAFDQARMA